MIKYFLFFISSFFIVNIALARTIEFKEKLIFEDESESNTCYKLVVNEKEKGWFFKLYEYEKKEFIIVYKCEKSDQAPLFPVAAEKAYGYVNQEPIYLNLLTGDITNLNILNWSFLSNPSFCNHLMAYFQTEKHDDSVKVIAAFFDLKAIKLITSLDIGEANIATDNPGYFGKPKWNKECTEAEFPPGDSKLKSTKLRLK